MPMPMNAVMLSTERLCLAPFTPADTEKVHRMSIEQSMRDWIPNQVYRDLEHTARVLGALMAQYEPRRHPSEGPFVLGVRKRNGNALIGHVGLSCVENMIEVGYAIEEAEQGRGYATEALGALCEWGMAEFRLTALHGLVAIDNLRSASVLRKVGFELQTRVRRMFMGRMDNVDIYRLGRLSPA